MIIGKIKYTIKFVTNLADEYRNFKQFKNGYIWSKKRTLELNVLSQ